MQPWQNAAFAPFPLALRLNYKSAGAWCAYRKDVEREAERTCF
jgi:hypothetical protein